MFYIRLAPRIDYLIRFRSKRYVTTEFRNKDDFQPFTGGISYSIGVLNFEKKKGLFFEIHGQNDFLKSQGNKIDDIYYNNFYGFNVGFNFTCNKTNNVQITK